MLLLAALAATVSQPSTLPTAAAVPAHATVRIIHAVARLRFEEIEESAPRQLRNGTIRSGADAGTPIRLIEYP